MLETEEETISQDTIELTADELLVIEINSDELLAIAIADPIVARQQVLAQESEKLEESIKEKKAAGGRQSKYPTEKVIDAEQAAAHEGEAGSHG